MISHIAIVAKRFLTIEPLGSIKLSTMPLDLPYEECSLFIISLGGSTLRNIITTIQLLKKN
jgi:hypothetical protein